MDLSEQSFLRFVELTYAAAEDSRLWRELYEQLRLAIGAKSIHMLGIDKSHGTLSYSDGANLPVEGELAYMHHYRLIDPRRGIAADAGVGAWTHFPAMLGEEVAATHPLYQEFLIPYDRRYNTECMLVDTPDARIVFSVLSGESEGPLSPQALDFLQRLQPHLQRACRLAMRTFVYSTQALVGHLLVNRLRQPVVLMTAGGEVVHTNDAAGELLRSTELVGLREGKLVMPQPHLEQLLQRCRELEDAIKRAGPGNPQATVEASHFRSVRVGEGGDALYAFFTILSPQREMGAFGLRPVVMLLFYHPQSSPAIDPSLLYAVFGLTPAECRIAALLAEGLSLKQIALSQGTQHDTVRKQLRSIYQKTATSRQPELVRLLLHLPQAMSQEAAAATAVGPGPGAGPAVD